LDAFAKEKEEESLLGCGGRKEGIEYRVQRKEGLMTRGEGKGAQRGGGGEGSNLAG